jgi:hypothetical protein
MSGLRSRAGATLALIAFASLTGFASLEAPAREGREPREQRAAERERQPARREAAARQNRRTNPGTEHASARREAPRAREHFAGDHPREMITRPLREQRAAAARLDETPHSAALSPARVVRYGNGLSGTVEHRIRPGFTSRTFVSGGRVLSTRVYQNHVWHQYGQVFGYETFVPGVRYPAVYYNWALAPWPRPIAYTWGWRVQPWYPMYGVLFVPYPVYTSPDQWMTDYMIAQSMQGAYAAQNSAPAPQPAPEQPAGAPAQDPELASPPPQPGDTSLVPQSGDASPAPAAPPPAITPQVKAELNSQIKVQLQEQQAAAATPATLRTPNTPPALRPNHVFFEVVQPLTVATAHGHCSLSANDYLKRTGGMSNDDWMIPVVVELSRPSDCPEGLQTRIGLNDLNAMENEQEARVLEAMQAASKSMGPNGPPSGVHPTLIADGSATADPDALDALRHAR